LNPLPYRQFYRRHLPHIQPPGATLFVTFRLAGSMPNSALERLSRDAEHYRKALATISDPEERGRRSYAEMNRLFGKWDAVLGQASVGPSWMGRAEVARVVAQALHAYAGRGYDLHAFCVMPNHVHAVITPLRREEGTYHWLPSIMRLLKGRTARQANVVLGRKGAFWEHENYDHVVRDEAELGRIITYVLDNPVKAGLSESRDEWEWSYCECEL
jgi:putative transposase